ncbi:hypothetical protein CXG81DRAFT_15498, partial [Caulochytrium protostelioides]
SFLKIIGRGCSAVADKIESWDALFTTTTCALKERGVGTTHRKWIANCVELYKKGIDPFEVPIPKRQKRYMREVRRAQALRRSKGLL